MLKRCFALLMALCMLLSALPALAEEEEEAAVSQEELDELKALDEDEDEDVPAIAAGPVYQEKSREDFNRNSPAIYTCRILEQSSLFAERDTTSKRLVYNKDSVTADVLYVGSTWAILRYKDTIGYVKRQRIYNVTPIDPVNTPPYGVQKSCYIATTATECPVRKSMSESDESWVVLNPGTMLSYISLNDLTDFIPVSPTDTPLDTDTPIAAYTSYYSTSTAGTNPNRIVNISVACQRLTRVMQPGESLDFNADVGPYRPGNGYKQAPVLINGVAKPGYGGGTCQVSSTLYNALLQLPGIEILQRRPHGPFGAKYLPHGVDAAVGSENLNLRFRNDYDFPILVEGHTSDDGALLMVIYRVDE